MPSKCNADPYLEGCHLHTLAYLRAKHISKRDIQCYQKRGGSGKAIYYKWVCWKRSYIRSWQREQKWAEQTISKSGGLGFYSAITQFALLLHKHFCKMLKFLPRSPSRQLCVIFTRECLHILCLSIRTPNRFGQNTARSGFKTTHLWKKDINRFVYMRSWWRTSLML